MRTRRVSANAWHMRLKESFHQTNSPLETIPLLKQTRSRGRGSLRIPSWWTS